MTAVEFIARSHRPRRTFAVQVMRGLAWTAALLAGLWLALQLLHTPGHRGVIASDDVDGQLVQIQPQWNAIFIVAAVATASTLTFRRLGKWAGRPRWLRPVGAVALLVAAAFATAPFKMTRDSIGHTCMPLVDAWHNVVANPGPADMHVWSSAYNMRISPYEDLARTRAFYRAQALRFKAIRTTPAFQRADRYINWTYSQSACAPQARANLEGSGAMLVGSGVLIAGAAWLSTRKRARVLVRD